MEWFTAALAAFAVIVPVELPDKTFVATLVLATRYRPWPVWLGVTAAFGIQCAVAVAAGRLLTLLPERPVHLAAAALFGVGAIILFVSARKADAAEKEAEERYEARFQETRTGWQAFGTSFLVLFAAEWGDLSQILTANLVASGHPPIPVFVGSWVGLAVVASVGVVVGRTLLKRIKLSAVRLVGAAVCAILCVATVITALP